MGAVACFQCIYTSNMSTEANYGLLKVDINPEPSSEKYMCFETKMGNYSSKSFKKTRSLKIDKGDFVRLKADNFFDEYELKEKLGEGGYGCVYKVIQKKTNYLRAVKAIKKRNVDKDEFINKAIII